MATLEEQIRELEARRAKGEVVPQLDALYKKQDDLTRKGYDSVVNPKPAPKPVSKRNGGDVDMPRQPRRDYSTPGKESLSRGRSTDDMPSRPRMSGIKEMTTPMAPMETGRTKVKPRSENVDRDKAYDTDVELKKGGKVSSASKRADGCAIRGKTRA